VTAHSDLVQMIAPAVSVLLLLLVLELARRRVLVEEHALFWMLGGGLLLLLSLRRDVLDRTARWLGIYYGPAVLLLVLVVLVFLAGLYFSAVVSRQRAQIVRLIEDQAILEARLRELEARRPGSTSDVSCCH
jgi:hypothetical protein